MPCDDGSRDHSYPVDNPKHMAALCAILSVVGTDVLSKVNWKEAGVSRHYVETWWKEHQQADERRRVYEARAKQQQAERDRVLSKLSPLERKILGV